MDLKIGGKPTAFHVMAKPTGSICNLDCTYCYYLEKENLYPAKKDWKMPEDVLEAFIKQHIEAHDVPVVQFAWQGGEPTLLGVNYFKKAVQFQKKHANGKKIENAFQTNGTFLNNEWGRFFSDNNFLIGLSVDGPREIHDHYRVTKGQKPSFDMVMQGLDVLHRFNVEFNTLTVVQDHNAQYPLEVYNFLKSIGSKYFQFIPIVERQAHQPTTDGQILVDPTYQEAASVTNWSVDPVEYGNFLCKVFDHWVLNDVGRIFVQIFDIALEAWYGQEPSLCIFKETCGDAMVIEHNGDLYSCDHFVYPKYKLGNIMNNELGLMATSLQQNAFGSFKRDSLPDFCKRCDYKFVCNGGCPKNRIIKSPDGQDGLNYLCAAYKMFFEHIDEPMRFMVGELQNQRPPANVMQWMAEQKYAKPDSKPKLKLKQTSRNAPCPCGSGKKFKHCHGKR